MEATALSRVSSSAHDSTAALIGSEFILPSQFFGAVVQGPEPVSEDHGECRLMLAVLEDATAIFMSDARRALDGRVRPRFREVEGWFASPDGSWPYSFESICATFDLNAEWLREGLNRWRTSQMPSPNTRRFRRVAGRRMQVIETRNRRRRQAV